MRFVLYLFLTFFLIGCDNVQQRFDPYKVQKQESSKQIELKKIEADTKIQIAKIDAQKEQVLKELESQTSIDVAQIQKEVSLKEQEVILHTQSDKNQLYQNLIYIFALIVLVGFALFIYLNRKNAQLQLRLKQEEIQSQKDLQQEASYNERINKMLDIVASKDTDDKVKDQIVQMLKSANIDKQTLEFKK
jgi:hypothetical protein